ncbi:protein hypothetical protein [Limosa lapponica baueri]|uniref:Uncharacterized protein n=1 Tax=Limosa lapponica baueri TaxID=1758121 RepID=A0A2I0TAV8_LIMLA|nr:protein hypothetical protein [Limosa lapponica baueri]
MGPYKPRGQEIPQSMSLCVSPSASRYRRHANNLSLKSVPPLKRMRPVWEERLFVSEENVDGFLGTVLCPSLCSQSAPESQPLIEVLDVTEDRIQIRLKFHVAEPSGAEKDLLEFLPYLSGVSGGFGVGEGWVRESDSVSESMDPDARLVP